MDFQTLATAIHKKQKRESPADNFNLLCFDPGHTTGWAVFEGLILTRYGQIDTSNIPAAVGNITELFQINDPEAVVIEDYRIYKWRAKHHIGSDMLTTRVIGCIETICVTQSVQRIVKQPAHTAKGFCTDKRLKDWGFYQTGQKHANDAIRHGCYYLLKGAIVQKQRSGSTVG